jgi:UDP-2-acetamido-2-deoxy-ribo-hexuluronate aminotransferase
MDTMELKNVSEIPFVDLQAQYAAYRSEIDGAVSGVLQSGRFIGGPEVSQLETELAAYTGAAHCVSCASGTDALLLSLLAAGIRGGDEVITTPFTFFATVETICLLGAIPVFVDIDEGTYNIDVERLEERVTERTRAIIPVSMFGQPSDIDSVNRAADRHGLCVIEDAAQSFGSEYRGRKSCHLSRVGCTSFFPTKPLGCYGDGGALFTDSDELALSLRELRNHGSAERYVHRSIGLNARLDAIQAAILRVKLRHLDDELARRRVIASRYDEAFGESGALAVPRVHPDRTSAYAQYSLRVNARTELMGMLARLGVPTAIHYPRPAYRQEALSGLQADPAEYPVVEKVCTEIVSIPMCAFLSPESQERVIGAVHLFLEGDQS